MANSQPEAEHMSPVAYVGIAVAGVAAVAVLVVLVVFKNRGVSRAFFFFFFSFVTGTRPSSHSVAAPVADAQEEPLLE